MPQSRRSPARNRSRRSRSHSPRRRKSRSRSRSRERKRSRDRHRSRSKSYDRKRSRSPAKKRYRSPSPRKRSRSPTRRSRSPRQRRRSRSSSSSGDRKYPVKRPADSSVKRHAPQRSRSRSPPPQKYKKAKDDYRRSPSPPSRPMPGGRMYSDQQPSTSSKTLFLSAKSSSSSSRGRDIIDYVVIPVAHRGPKMEKLDKRFQTLEQRASGPFEIDENITIGIHRGPSHIQLDDDYDMPVNYSFNTKTFKMLFPKKDYVKTIFDRDEILAFHHDDVLDEEAYVEKRTISIKPSEKPKSRSSRHDDHDMDYKITFGVDREGHGDRRMVKDSSSRSSRHSRSDYPDVPVTVRLDPKPDPRYEKIYHEQQRKDSQSMSFSESSSRKPGDLRYNLMRRQSDGDRGSDRHDRSMTDARSRIEARRNEGRDTRDDKRGRFGASPPRGRSGASPPRGRSGASPPRDRKRSEKELPDFKNRPEKPKKLPAGTLKITELPDLPGKSLEKPVVWIIGSSVIKDLARLDAKEAKASSNLGSKLADKVSSIIFHGEDSLKMEDLGAAVKFMLKKNTSPPNMIVFHCGELNIATSTNKAIVDELKGVLANVLELIPGVKLVWSQILPPWNVKKPDGSTLAKSRRRINFFVKKYIVSEEVGGGYLYHTEFRTNMNTKFYKESRDGNLHLNKKGMKRLVYQFSVGIEYFMTGAGSIFPNIKWPPEQISNIAPHQMCMLGKEQIQSIRQEQFMQLSREQIQELSKDQLDMFHVHQLAWVYCKQFIQNLSSRQVNCLTRSNLSLLSREQLDYFTIDQEMWLTAKTKKLIEKRKKDIEHNIHEPASLSRGSRRYRSNSSSSSSSSSSRSGSRGRRSRSKHRRHKRRSLSLSSISSSSGSRSRSRRRHSDRRKSRSPPKSHPAPPQQSPGQLPVGYPPHSMVMPPTLPPGMPPTLPPGMPPFNFPRPPGFPPPQLPIPGMPLPVMPAGVHWPGVPPPAHVPTSTSTLGIMPPRLILPSSGTYAALPVPGTVPPVLKPPTNWGEGEAAGNSFVKTSNLKSLN